MATSCRRSNSSRGGRPMRTHVPASLIAIALALATSPVLLSQRGGAPAAPQTPAPPAAARDLSGVWMMRNPPGKNGPWTNYTYTDPMKNPPKLTAWGQEQLKLAKDSNG